MEATATMGGTPLTMKQAAVAILEEHGGPMRAKDLTELALSRGMIRATGKTPAATMQAQLSVAAKNEDTFVRTAPGTYGLIGRDVSGQTATPMAPPAEQGGDDRPGIVQKVSEVLKGD